MKNVYYDEEPSIWRGAALSPLVAPFAATILLPLVDPNSSVSGAVFYFPIIFLVSIAYAYVGVGLVGLPLAIWLRRRRMLSALPLCFLGVLGGEVLWFLPRLAREPLLTAAQALSQAMLCGGVALSVAVVFCLASGITIRSSGRL